MISTQAYESDYERIKRLYLTGRLRLNGLKNAKKLKVITAEQYDEIIAAKAEQGSNQ